MAILVHWHKQVAEMLLRHHFSKITVGLALVFWYVISIFHNTLYPSGWKSSVLHFSHLIFLFTDISPKNENCVTIYSPRFFQTCMIYCLLFNTKENVLRNVPVFQFGPHWLPLYGQKQFNHSSEYPLLCSQKRNNGWVNGDSFHFGWIYLVLPLNKLKLKLLVCKTKHQKQKTTYIGSIRANHCTMKTSVQLN